MVATHVPNSVLGSKLKMKLTYGGNKVNELFVRLSKCDAEEPLLINIVKLYNKPDCLTFDVFGRVLSGTIHKNQTVKVLGQNYTMKGMIF
jgi:U5 small nuclear ribonucleoprotein component